MLVNHDTTCTLGYIRGFAVKKYSMKTGSNAFGTHTQTLEIGT